jgi:hypothetical protein
VIFSLFNDFRESPDEVAEGVRVDALGKGTFCDPPAAGVANSNLPLPAGKGMLGKGILGHFIPLPSIPLPRIPLDSFATSTVCSPPRREPAQNSRSHLRPP